MKPADVPVFFPAALIGIILIVYADVSYCFLIVLLFCILALCATRYRYVYKIKWRRASHGGARGYLNDSQTEAFMQRSGVCGNHAQPVFLALFVEVFATAQVIPGNEIGRFRPALS